jgi:hypothetical protein
MSVSKPFNSNFRNRFTFMMSMAAIEGTRTMKDMLAPDETVINPHYMRQLLLYGVRLGREKDLNADQLLHDAEVGERSVDEG